MCKPVACFLAFLLAVLPCMAQGPSPALASPIIIPAGTTLSVVLTQQISSNATHTGDQIHAQLVSPIVVGSQVAIPAGTYLQGTVRKVTQQDERVELALKSASLAFPNGYVAQLGAVAVESSEGWWRPSPNSRRGAALIPFLFAPVVGAGIGAAVGKDGSLTPGSISNGQVIPGSITPATRARDAGIGLGIGAGIMAVGMAVYFSARHHGGPDYFYPAGAPMDSVLVSPVSIDATQVADSANQPQPVPIQPIAQRPQPHQPSPDSTPSGTCYAPDTPGTPPTTIPGTPAIGDVPGTPDIVIPGTPSIPGGVIPCP